MTDLTITLSGASAERLRKLMQDENYATAEDAVADALDALDDTRDTAIDAWLRETIVARANATEQDSSRLLTAAEVRERLSGQS